MLQTIVNKKLAFGVVGSFYDDSPRRVAPYNVSGGAISRIYTADSSDPAHAVLGGSGDILGIAVNSKEYIVTGLNADLSFRDGAIAQICDMGHVVVKADNEVTVGNVAYYKETDGTLHAGETGQTIEGYVEIPGSKFVFVDANEGEVAVLELK